MDRTADVVVVGGGIRGVGIAYYLARAGVRVTLVSAGKRVRVGGGAYTSPVRMRSTCGAAIWALAPSSSAVAAPPQSVGE